MADNIAQATSIQLARAAIAHDIVNHSLRSEVAGLTGVEYLRRYVQRFNLVYKALNAGADSTDEEAALKELK